MITDTKENITGRKEIENVTTKILYIRGDVKEERKDRKLNDEEKGS